MLKFKVTLVTRDHTYTVVVNATDVMDAITHVEGMLALNAYGIDAYAVSAIFAKEA